MRGGLALFPQPGIGSACAIFGFCTAFCQLCGPMGAVGQKYPGLLAVRLRPIPAWDQQTSMHRQASRNLGPTSNFLRIAEKEAGAKLHLGCICILLAAWDQAKAIGRCWTRGIVDDRKWNIHGRKGKWAVLATFCKCFHLWDGSFVLSIYIYGAAFGTATKIWDFKIWSSPCQILRWHIIGMVAMKRSNVYSVVDEAVSLLLFVGGRLTRELRESSVYWISNLAWQHLWLTDHQPESTSPCFDFWPARPATKPDNTPSANISASAVVQLRVAQFCRFLRSPCGDSSLFWPKFPDWQCTNPPHAGNLFLFCTFIIYAHRTEGISAMSPILFESAKRSWGEFKTLESGGWTVQQFFVYLNLCPSDSMWQ